MVSDEWFQKFQDECEALETYDLFGYAASAAARELIENWSDCWAEGPEAFGTRSITEMLVSDINETINRLAEWRDELKRK